jgi:putative transposase
VSSSPPRCWIGWQSGASPRPSIEKGSPQQNPFVERFNGSMRDELLNGEEFEGLVEARVVIGAWVDQYNTLRPQWARHDDAQCVRRQLQRGT